MSERRRIFYGSDGLPQRDRRHKWQRIGPGQVVLYLLLAALIVAFWRDSTNKSADIRNISHLTCENQRVGIAATMKLRIIIQRSEPLLTSTDSGDERLRSAFEDYLALTARVRPPTSCPHDAK